MATGLPFDDVLAAAQAGAAWAFEVLYRDLSPSVTGYLRLHGAAEPDDLASETFIGVFTGLGGFSGDEAALRGWVFTIAHRRLVDDWRRRSRRPQVADDPGDLAEFCGGDVEDDALSGLGTETVHRMCAELPDDQRAVLLLRILADLTIEQVAQAMGRSVGATKALQRRGLRTLRTRLENASEKVGAGAYPYEAPPAMTGVR
jgi:RNA polymerase sigma-70 factor (ECF subfamily)